MMAELRPSTSLLPERTRNKYFQRNAEYNNVVDKYKPDVVNAAYQARYNPEKDMGTIFSVWDSQQGVLKDIVQMSDIDMQNVNPKVTPELANLIRQMAATYDLLPAEGNFVGRSAYDIVKKRYTQNPGLQSAPGLASYYTAPFVQGFIQYSKAGGGAVKAFQDPVADLMMHIHGTAAQKAFHPIAKQTWNKGTKKTQFEPDTLVTELENIVNDPFGDKVQQTAAQKMLDGIKMVPSKDRSILGDALTRTLTLSYVISSAGPLLESAISHIGMTPGALLTNTKALAAALQSPQVVKLLDKFGVKGNDLSKLLDQAHIQSLFEYESQGVFGPGYKRPPLLNPLPVVDAALKRVTAGVSVLAAAKKLGPKYGFPDGVPLSQVLNPTTPQMKAASAEIKGLMGQALNDVHGMASIGNRIPATEGSGRVIFALKRARLAQADAKMRLMGKVLQQGVQGIANRQAPKFTPEALQAARMLAVDFIASGPRAVLSPEIYSAASMALSTQPSLAPMAIALQNAAVGQAPAEDNPIKLLMEGKFQSALANAGNFPGVLGTIDDIMDTNFSKYTSPMLDVAAWAPDLDGMWDIGKQLQAGKALIDNNGQPLTEDQLEGAISAAGALGSIIPVAGILNTGVSAPAIARVTNAIINATRGYRSTKDTKYATNPATEAASALIGGSGPGGHVHEMQQQTAQLGYQDLHKDMWAEFNRNGALSETTLKRLDEFEQKYAPLKYPDMAPDLARKKFLQDIVRPVQDAEVQELTNLLYKASTTGDEKLRNSLFDKALPRLDEIQRLDKETYDTIIERAGERLDKLEGSKR